MRGLGFKKGNLGDINFRQQIVKIKDEIEVNKGLISLSTGPARTRNPPAPT